MLTVVRQGIVKNLCSSNSLTGAQRNRKRWLAQISRPPQTIGGRLKALLALMVENTRERRTKRRHGIIGKGTQFARAKTMAVLQAILAAVGRQLGRLLNTAFSWATVLLFGKVSERRQLYLSAI